MTISKLEEWFHELLWQGLSKEPTSGEEFHDEDVNYRKSSKKTYSEEDKLI